MTDAISAAAHAGTHEVCSSMRARSSAAMTRRSTQWLGSPARCGIVSMLIVTPPDHLHAHGGDPAQISSSPINMSPACIRGVATHLLNARITFDKFHVVAAASIALDRTRRTLQKDAARMVRRHRDGVVAWTHTQHEPQFTRDSDERKKLSSTKKPRSVSAAASSCASHSS